MWANMSVLVEKGRGKFEGAHVGWIGFRFVRVPMFCVRAHAHGVLGLSECSCSASWFCACAIVSYFLGRCFMESQLPMHKSCCFD